MPEPIRLQWGLPLGTAVYAEVGTMPALDAQHLTADLPTRYTPLPVQHIIGELVAWNGHCAVVRLSVPAAARGREIAIDCW